MWRHVIRRSVACLSKGLVWSHHRSDLLTVLNMQDTTAQDDDPITIAELAVIAKTKLKKEVWDYYECGADSQTVLRENEAAFKT